MANYNAMAGATEAGFNRLAAQLHDIVPTKGDFEFEQPINVKGSYDVRSPFIFRFRNSELVREYKEGLLASAEQMAMEADAATTESGSSEFRQHELLRCMAESIDMKSSFEISSRLVHIQLSFAGAPAREVTAQVTFGVVANFDPDWKFKPQILTVQVRLIEPKDPALEKLLNESIFPALLPQFNEYLGKGFSLPGLEFRGVKFSGPDVLVSEGHIAGYAAIKGQVSRAPESIQVHDPRGVFVQFDSTVANAVATEELKKRETSVKVKDEKDGPLGTGIGGEASYSIKFPKSSFTLGLRNSVTASLCAKGNGRAHFRVKTFGRWGNWVGVGASLETHPKVRAGVVLTGGWVRIFQFDLLQALIVKLEFENLPEFINRLLSLLTSSFTDGIARHVISFLGRLTIPVFKLPERCFPVAGRKVKIGLADAQVWTTFQDRKTLCEVTGVAAAIEVGQSAEATQEEQDSLPSQSRDGAVA